MSKFINQAVTISFLNLQFLLQKVKLKFLSWGYQSRFSLLQLYFFFFKGIEEGYSCSSVEEHAPSMYKTLDLVPRTAKK